jgi:hypothetical protein
MEIKSLYLKFINTVVPLYYEITFGELSAPDGSVLR